jgi:hypothetical protein
MSNLGLLRAHQAYCICYGNEGGSSSVSDVDRLVTTRKFLESIFNILVLLVLICRCEVQTYLLFFCKVAHTSNDVACFVEWMNAALCVHLDAELYSTGLPCSLVVGATYQSERRHDRENLCLKGVRTQIFWRKLFYSFWTTKYLPGLREKSIANTFTTGLL